MTKNTLKDAIALRAGRLSFRMDSFRKGKGGSVTPKPTRERRGIGNDAFKKVFYGEDIVGREFSAEKGNDDLSLLTSPPIFSERRHRPPTAQRNTKSKNTMANPQQRTRQFKQAAGPVDVDDFIDSGPVDLDDSIDGATSQGNSYQQVESFIQSKPVDLDDPVESDNESGPNKNGNNENRVFHPSTDSSLSGTFLEKNSLVASSCSETVANSSFGNEDATEQRLSRVDKFFNMMELLGGCGTSRISEEEHVDFTSHVESRWRRNQCLPPILEPYYM